MNNKILIIQTAFLGDLLLSAPLLKRIKKNYPDSSVTLVCRAGCGTLYKELKLADTVIEINKNSKDDYKQKIKLLKKEVFDIIFAPHYSFRTGFFVFSLKSKIKVGFKEWWNRWIFTHSVTRELLLPDALRQMQLIGLLDSDVQTELNSYLEKRKNILKIDLSELAITNKQRLVVPPLFSQSLKNEIKNHPHYSATLEKYKIPSKSIFLAPGSVWGTKRWTEQGYREVAEHYSNQNKNVYLIGSPQERELCERISQGLPNAKNIAGVPSLFELFILMTEAQLLVCNDSGSMHMASVTELPTVSIFGPTVLEIGYQPWQDQALVVENNSLDCRPCGKHGPQMCPLGHHRCMRDISSHTVIASTQKLIG